MLFRRIALKHIPSSARVPYGEADGVSHAQLQGQLHDDAKCFGIGLATVDLALPLFYITQSQWSVPAADGRECVCGAAVTC